MRRPSVAAPAFGCADVLTKLTFQAGADVLTNTLFRGFIRLPLLAAWLLFEAAVATIGSAIVLGEVMTPLQALGWAAMVGALVAFQMRR